jgi:Uma2 family endonuclease
MSETATMPTLPEGRETWTYEDYAHLPDDGVRYEVLDGELVVAPSPMTRHQRVSMKLSLAVGGYVESQKLGECFCAPYDVVLDRRTIVQPDLIFVSNDRSSIITENNIQGAPDLVVEILSPSTAQRDRVRKLRLYTRFGIPHVWFLDPGIKTLEEFILEGESYRVVAVHAEDEEFRPLLFPGLSILLGEIWRT